MQPIWRPPLAVGPAGPAVDRVHVILWLRASIPEWETVREAHLHLVRAIVPDAVFEAVDVSRHPLRPAPEVVEPEDIRGRGAAWLEEWLGGWRPTVWRSAELGIVSELGEAEGAFRRRVLRLLQPELEREIERARAEALPLLPWRRRRVIESRRSERERMAAKVARLASSFDAWQPADPRSLVRKVEIGMLRVSEGLRLAAPAPRDPLAVPDRRGPIRSAD